MREQCNFNEPNEESRGNSMRFWLSSKDLGLHARYYPAFPYQRVNELESPGAIFYVRMRILYFSMTGQSYSGFPTTYTYIVHTYTYVASTTFQDMHLYLLSRNNTIDCSICVRKLKKIYKSLLCIHCVKFVIRDV